MEAHMKRVCRVSYFQLKTIRNVQNMLSPEAPERLMDPFVTARLDYCNSILVGIPDAVVQKLQLLHNSAARLVSKTDRYEHITPVLKAMHWLPVRHVLRSSYLPITPCMNWRQRISTIRSRFITQQGHWSPQDQTYR